MHTLTSIFILTGFLAAATAFAGTDGDDCREASTQANNDCTQAANTAKAGENAQAASTIASLPKPGQNPQANALKQNVDFYLATKYRQGSVPKGPGQMQKQMRFGEVERGPKGRAVTVHRRFSARRQKRIRPKFQKMKKACAWLLSPQLWVIWLKAMDANSSGERRREYGRAIPGLPPIPPDSTAVAVARPERASQHAGADRMFSQRSCQRHERLVHGHYGAKLCAGRRRQQPKQLGRFTDGSDNNVHHRRQLHDRRDLRGFYGDLLQCCDSRKYNSVCDCGSDHSGGRDSARFRNWNPYCRNAVSQNFC